MTRGSTVDRALIEEGTATAGGDPGPVMKTDTWTTPGSAIELVDGNLVVMGPLRREPQTVVPTREMLYDFAVLSRSEDDGPIRDFARRYGLFGLCSHHLPTGHAFSVREGLVRWTHVMFASWCTPLGYEPISTWRFWSRQAAAVLRVIARLRHGTPGDHEDWNVLCEPGPWAGGIAVFDQKGGYPWTWPELPGTLVVDRRLAAVAIDTWQEVAGVRQTVVWQAARPELMWVTHGLLGALGSRVLLAAADVDGLALCAGCGAGHVPARPRALGEKSFCPTCRNDKKKPRARASAAYREREATRASRALGRPMSERAVELARRVAQANDEVVAFVEGLTDEEWQAPCEREGRTVGQVVQHIAAGHRVIGGIVEAMALGTALPVAARRTEADGARYNARQAARFAHGSREGGIRLLRRNGGTWQRRIASLTDDQLDRATGTVAGPITTAQQIEHGLLGHLSRHLDAVRETVEDSRSGLARPHGMPAAARRTGTAPSQRHAG